MNERFEKIVRHPATIPAVVGALAFGSGVGIGYILGRRATTKEETVNLPEQLEIDFDSETLNDYIRERGRVVIEVDDTEAKAAFEDAQTSIKKLVETIEQVTEEDDDEPELVRHSVFADNDDTWDYEEEVKNRTEGVPYILHRDEFYSEERGYSQITLTYYVADDILCDEEDAPIYNYTDVIGPFKFGHGSGDPNVFYIRNDARQAEYEILQHHGSYAEEVLGLEYDQASENELRHSSIKKFRPE